MRIGLYNRHLATLGGGERYSLTIAALLSRGNQVDVVSHVPVDPVAVQQRLHLDLDRVNWRVVPDLAPAQFGPLSGTYDFFINASNLDFVPHQAAQSAMVVFFPLAAGGGAGAQLRRLISGYLRDWFLLPRWLSGVYGEEAGGVRRLAAQARIEMPATWVPYCIHFCVRSAIGAVQRVRVSVDDVPQVELSVDRQFVPCTLTVPSSRERKAPVIAIDTASAAPGCQFALEMTSWKADHPQQTLYRRWFVRRLPGLDVRLRNPQPADIVAVARTYQLIWGISDYTRQWIDRYWGLPSVRLYPPVDVARLTPASHKLPKILSVGRYFAGQHNKKHLVMIAAFKALVDQGLRGWEFHLAGGVNQGAEHARYLAQVKDAARGYPIHVHVDIPFAQLAVLYGESALYWHAAGYGEDEVRDPIRAEHFGITTVEAMAAGCVPIVIARGGQPELIRHGVDGYLWQSLDELLATTRQAVADPVKRQTVAAAAQASSRRFDLPSFSATLTASLVAAGIRAEVG